MAEQIGLTQSAQFRRYLDRHLVHTLFTGRPKRHDRYTRAGDGHFNVRGRARIAKSAPFNRTVVAAPFLTGMATVRQSPYTDACDPLPPALQDEIADCHRRPLTETSVAEPTAGPRQLTCVKNPGAASVMMKFALARLLSARTMVMRAGPIADSTGITKLICPQPAAAQPMPARRVAPRLSVTCTETPPSVSGRCGPLLCASRSAITGP